MAEVSDIAGYMQAAAAKRFAWGARFSGSQDCCTFAWDWVALRTGVDAMADLRGRYGDMQEALSLLRAHGCETLSEAVRQGAARAGLVETAEPRLGDIGLVAMDMEDGRLGAEVLCVRLSTAWAAPTVRGVAETRAPASICWRVP